jgi:hypothetical protein
MISEIYQNIVLMSRGNYICVFSPLPVKTIFNCDLCGSQNRYILFLFPDVEISTARLHNTLICRHNIDCVYTDEHNKNHTCSFS